MNIRQNWSATKAQEDVCHPHAIHNVLLKRNIQKPHARRASFDDATHHEAKTVISIAGHCTQFIQSNLVAPQSL